MLAPFAIEPRRCVSMGALQHGRPLLTHHREYSTFHSHPLAGNAVIKTGAQHGSRNPGLRWQQTNEEKKCKKKVTGIFKRKRERKRGGKPLVFAVKNQATHSTRLKNVMASLAEQGGQGKTLSTAWDQSCLANTCKPLILETKLSVKLRSFTKFLWK